MSNLARNLIYAVSFLSFWFLAWSIGLYTNQQPWEKHIKTELSERIKGLVEARDRADARWADAMGKVAKLEAEIPARDAWYAERMRIASTGKDKDGKDVANPVTLVESAEGLVQLKAGAPFQIDGKPAFSIDGFKSAIDKQLNEIRETKLKINRVVAEAAALTLKINGTKSAIDAITAEEKGMRGQLADAERVAKNAKLEQEYLQSPLTNDTVELELLRRRQVALEARLKELGTSSARKD